MLDPSARASERETGLNLQHTEGLTVLQASRSEPEAAETHYKTPTSWSGAPH